MVVEAIDVDVDVKGHEACNVSAKIWNMPESHAAQPLDYLSLCPNFLRSLLKLTPGTLAPETRSAMLPIP